MTTIIQANVPCTWSKGTTLATSVQSTLTNSGAMFDFQIALCGNKKQVTDSKGNITTPLTYSVRLDISFTTTDYSTSQLVESSIYTACNSAKTANTTLTFESYQIER